MRYLPTRYAKVQFIIFYKNGVETRGGDGRTVLKIQH